MTNPILIPTYDPLSPIRTLADKHEGNASPVPTGQTSPTSSAPSPTTTTTSSALPDFRELLALMMMGMTMQGQGGEESGFSMNSMLAPLMMTLMEKLMAQEVTDVASEDTSTAPTQQVPNGLPVEGRFTQDFHPGHNGVDIAIVTGTPIQSTMDGTIIHAGWNNQGYGNLVIVENEGYRTYYAHLSEIPVEVGQTIRAGDTIGLSGNTGNSTGPHLHYEVRYNGQPLDPAEYY